MENAVATQSERRPRRWDEVFRSLDYDCEPERGLPLLRGLAFEVKEVPGKPRTLRFVGSDETEDRHGEVISVAGWDLAHFQRNPVFLWAHDYLSPPVGKAVSVQARDGKLEFEIEFADPETYAFADTIYRLYRGGFLRATSVGFVPHEWVNEEIGEDGKPVAEGAEASVVRKRRRYTKQELLELSAVPVPANPNATISEGLDCAVKRGVITAQEAKAFESQGVQGKTVIPFTHYPLDPEDAEWDGPMEVAAADVENLRRIAAWFDAEALDVKGSYKLPHHRAAEGNHTVWNGVSAAMGALLGARGGVEIPDSDRRGVYEHLAKHYAEFGKEAPEFKAYSAEELRGMADAGAIVLPVEQSAAPGAGRAPASRAPTTLETLAEAIEGLRGEIRTLGDHLAALREAGQKDWETGVTDAGVMDAGLYDELLDMRAGIQGELVTQKGGQR